MKKINIAWILPLTIFFVWFFVSNSGNVPEIVLPKLSSVYQSFVDQIQSGRLLTDLSVSLMRIVKGYGLAIVVGITLGVLMGISPKVNEFFSITITSIRQIPMMAWIPLLVMWFGIGESSKIAVIFLASYFPIMMNTMNGMKQTDQKLVEVGKMYQLNHWQLFTKIYLPSAIPSVFVGLKLGLGISWMAVVGAEMIAASSGIGFRINDARSLMQSPVVFTGIISIAVVGLLMDTILHRIGKWCMPWEARK